MPGKTGIPFDQWCRDNKPELLLEWHPTKNLPLTPDKIASGSHKTVWWLGKCGHEWEYILSQRVKGKGCPFCFGRKVLPGFNNLATKRPDLMEEWDYSKNDENPLILSVGSNLRVWWKCKNGHEWQATIDKRSLSGEVVQFVQERRLSRDSMTLPVNIPNWPRNGILPRTVPKNRLILHADPTR